MAYSLRQIVAGVATLEPDEPVLTSALELAERSGATLHLVHGFELPSIAWERYGRLGYLEGPSPETLADSLREQFARIVRSRSPDVSVEYHMVPGRGGTAVLEVAEEVGPELVIVGATRHGAIARTLLGTTAGRVMRQALVPVLVLRRRLARPLHRVLLTTDLEPFSVHVHDVALRLVAKLGTAAAPVVRSIFVAGPLLHLPSSLSEDRLEEFAEEQLSEFLDRWRESGWKIEGLVRLGDPSTEIVTYATEWDPDLVVLGNHGGSARERWSAGHVAEATLRDVPSNVLVIPALPGS